MGWRDLSARQRKAGLLSEPQELLGFLKKEYHRNVSWFENGSSAWRWGSKDSEMCIFHLEVLFVGQCLHSLYGRPLWLQGKIWGRGASLVCTPWPGIYHASLWASLMGSLSLQEHCPEHPAGKYEPLRLTHESVLHMWRAGYHTAETCKCGALRGWCLQGPMSLKLRVCVCVCMRERENIYHHS